MRRLSILAAFVVLIALASASAQRGGMHSYGGGHGVSSARAAGGHAYGGMHAGWGARHSYWGNGSGGERNHRTGGFHHYCYRCRSRYGYAGYGGFGYAGYYSPDWWWDSSSSYDFDEEREREAALADEMDARSVEEQRERERDNWDRERDRDFYTQRPQAREEERPAAVPATVLVFRDRHQREIGNYAIAGGTLWVLNQNGANKIPLEQLDLDATVKKNDERGVDFRVPGPSLSIMIMR